MNAPSKRAMDQDQSEVTGRAIAPGLGMGQAWVVGDVLKGTGMSVAGHPVDVEGELALLKQAIAETLQEFEQTALRIEAEFDAALAGIFRAHGMILRDPVALGELEHELRSSKVTAETAVRQVFRRWLQKFESVDNQVLRQRADDVLDLGRNIVGRLRGGVDTRLQSIPDRSVLVVERLLPSDVVRLPRARVAAIVVESLGQGSHAALLAREKGIPTITDLPGILSRISNETELLVDGFIGKLIIAPQAATRQEFQQRLEKRKATLVHCKNACREPAYSVDGQLIRVEANIGIQDDVELALDNGADGVGLLRIEQLYFARNTPPTEAELFADLKRLVAPLANRPVTIRLLDIGGDKPLPYLRLPATSNPVLGRRGVRVLLEYSQLVRTQMGAILRLSQEHPVRVLIPMVTLEDDVAKMREAFDTISAENNISRPPPFGAMVETPAAALAVGSLLRHVDFLCVGTNDLAQYTLAAGRDDAAVNDYYLDSHESILRLLGIIMADAKEQSVTLCGELAGRETWLPCLLQMGFRTLSVAPSLIPSTKDRIRTVDIGGSAADEPDRN
jgi:phosphoenolpyruvate-protein phosphotransferase